MLVYFVQYSVIILLVLPSRNPLKHHSIVWIFHQIYLTQNIEHFRVTYWNKTCSCWDGLFVFLGNRENESSRDNRKRNTERKGQERCCFRFKAGWNETHDVPLKPTSAAGLYKYTCFPPLSVVFTSPSFWNTVSAWSCLVWPSVLLPCLTGKGPTLCFYALFYVSHIASQNSGMKSQIFGLFSSLTFYVHLRFSSDHAFLLFLFLFF